MKIKLTTHLEKRLFKERNALLLAIELMQWDGAMDRLYEMHKRPNALIGVERLRKAVQRAKKLAARIRKIIQEEEF